MSKKILAVDVDDVLADSTESVRNIVNEQFNISLDKKHYLIPGEYWEYYERVWKAHGLEDKVNWDLVHTDMTVDQSHVPPMLEAYGVLKNLSRHFKIIVVTYRDVSWKDATIEWLNMHYPGIFSEVLFVKDGGADQSKGTLCQTIGASWLIDDNVEHCSGAVKCGTKAMLFGEYGWHQNVPPNLIICKTWQKVAEYFKNEIRK